MLNQLSFWCTCVQEREGVGVGRGLLGREGGWYIINF